MTNYKQARTNGKRGANIKDGNGPLARQRDYNALLRALGFTRTDWNKWSYSWQGDFPTFALAPGGHLNGETGFIAKFKEIEILFPYGTKPAFIKDRLDDEILEIMRLQADAADPLPISPIIPFLGEPLPYQPVIVEGQEIGSEIEF